MDLEQQTARQRSDKEGWTWWKEILGTAIAVLAVTVPVGVALIAWGSHVESVLAVSAQRLATLEMQRGEIAAKLDRISDKIDYLSLRVSRNATDAR